MKTKDYSMLNPGLSGLSMNATIFKGTTVPNFDSLDKGDILIRVSSFKKYVVDGFAEVKAVRTDEIDLDIGWRNYLTLNRKTFNYEFLLRSPKIDEVIKFAERRLKKL